MPELTTLVLRSHDIRVIANHVGVNALMDQLISRLEAAFRSFQEGSGSAKARDGFLQLQPTPSLLEWMPYCHGDKSITIKVVSYNPHNPLSQNLPTILASSSTYDTKTGHLEAVHDGVLTTALRTGAASALASRHLASPESATVGMIGCGAQAVTQLHALSRVFSLKTALVYDTNARVAESLIRRLAFLPFRLLVSSLQNIQTEADIICTATTTGIRQAPVFVDYGLKPHIHVNAVGSDLPGKTEVPVSLLERSLVSPDYREQALSEGECQQLAPAAIGPELSEICMNPEAYRSWQLRSTVFDSTGFALEDHVASQLLLEYATRLNVGIRVPIEVHETDPYDPYCSITSSSENNGGVPSFRAKQSAK